VNPIEAAALVLAGFGGGLCGSLAGLASLVSYPALLAVGAPPITANATNTVSLVFNGLGYVIGSRPELRSRAARVRRLAPAAALGGTAGAVALLLTPGNTFSRIVPYLIGLSGLLILVPARTRGAPFDMDRDPLWLRPIVFAIACYGGYFGAAAGVLLLAALLATGEPSLANANATKTILLWLANLVAAVIFVAKGEIDWAAAVPLALGFLAAGRLGPVLVRRLPARPLRVAIGLSALGLAIALWLEGR